MSKIYATANCIWSAIVFRDSTFITSYISAPHPHLHSQEAFPDLYEIIWDLKAH